MVNFPQVRSASTGDQMCLIFGSRNNNMHNIRIDDEVFRQFNLHHLMAEIPWIRKRKQKLLSGF